MRSQHIWTERDEQGSKREVRATRFGGMWRLQAKTAGEVDWTYYERPLLDDLFALKEILVRKYQRRRASNEDVASVEKLIADQNRGRELDDVYSHRLEPISHSLESSCSVYYFYCRNQVSAEVTLRTSKHA
jgi:hypothetical protein